MIVVMKSGAGQEAVDHVIELIRDFGLRDHVIVGTDRTVIAAIGDKRGVDKGAIESAPEVDRVVPILAPYKVASREVKQEPSVVPLGANAQVGGSALALIAGPCSVESREQLLETAHAVKEAGAVGLRGGAFKPRTNPYEFQGLGEKGLELLAQAREETGLAVVTEIMSIDQVELVSKYADVLQIGTRNMHNFNLLTACGETDRSVLLKRGWSATLNEFLLAAEYIINAGNKKVVLCERGIRTHESYVRNTLPLAIVPAIKRGKPPADRDRSIAGHGACLHGSGDVPGVGGGRCRRATHRGPSRSGTRDDRRGAVDYARGFCEYGGRPAPYRRGRRTDGLSGP